MPRVFANENGCWEWLGYIDQLGYGRWGKRKAHRVAYEFFVGPIPEGLTLDHLCRVRHCVNPAHLEPVPLPENILRGTAPAAHNARKTHCKNGHPFNEENTVWRPWTSTKTGRTRTKRECRICGRERRNNWNQQNAKAAAA